MAGGKGGGAWKVAYADFVTAMMAFFMVMWLVGQDQEKKAAVQEYFQDPWAKSRFSYNRSRNPTMTEQKAGTEQTNKHHDGSNPHEVPHDKPESPNNKQAKLVTIRSPQRTATGAIITFEMDTVELSEDAKGKLVILAPQMAGLPNKIDIRGHVSPKMVFNGDDDAMWDLSYKRSRATKRYLSELGIEEKRMRISVAGPHEPLVTLTDDSSDDSNARVEVFVLSETVGQFEPEKRPNTINESSKGESAGAAHGADAHGSSASSGGHGKSGGSKDSHGGEKSAPAKSSHH